MREFPLATIIVCTFNRAKSLRRTLDCLAQQRVSDATSWEVIVVDNNSIDETHKIVLDVQESGSIPTLRYEFEARQGLSYARNHGIRAAQGRLLLFTDDDVCPREDWLQCVIEAMNRFQCDACGGYIAPQWEKKPPTWLTDRFFGFLALRTEDNGPYAITDVHNAPFGANMAFRRSVFEHIGYFDTNRGRKGTMLSGGEELELFERLLKKNGKVMYIPSARVEHYIEAFRLKKKYFRKWRYQGSYNISKNYGVTGTRRLLGVPLYVFPQLLRAVKKAAVAKFTKPADEAFYREIIVWHFLGTIAGLFAHYRTGDVILSNAKDSD